MKSDPTAHTENENRAMSHGWMRNTKKCTQDQFRVTNKLSEFTLIYS